MSRSLLRRAAPLIRTRLLENQRVLLLSKSSLSSSSSSSSSSSVAAVTVASDESGPGYSFPSSSSAPDGLDEIHMTESCIRRMKELHGNHEPSMKKMLRISIETGGCSGFQYIFGLDDQKNPDDRVFEKDGVKLVVDNISYDFVKGATVDYVEELIRSAFLVTSNPSAVGGCSCKSSFMVK